MLSNSLFKLMIYVNLLPNLLLTVNHEKVTETFKYRFIKNQEIDFICIFSYSCTCIFEGLAIQNPPRNPGISTLVGQGMLKPSPPQGAPPQPQPTPPTLGQQPSMGPQAVVRPGQCPEPNKLYNY